MTTIAIVSIVIMIIVAILWYHNPTPIKNKTCRNCRFYDEPNCTNYEVMDKLMSSIPVEIEIPQEPCTQWDWNGSE